MSTNPRFGTSTEVPSDTEEENHENHYYNRSSSKFRGYNNTDNLSEHSSGGGGGSGSGSRPPYHRYNSHPYSTTSSQSSSTTTTNQRATNATQSSHSTPIRNRYRNNNSYGGYGEKYKSSRSNSTASEPKITFNEDEYTRITTPRQDVLFKKGYLSKKKPTVVNNIDNSSCAQINGGSISSSSNDGQANATTNGGSCGESNPSTGYNSTTGGGTPEHHSLDGGDYYDTDLEQPQQFIFHNGFVDQHGVFFVNGYDPYSVMLIGPPAPPPGQFIHPVDFYPPPSAAGVPCYPQIVPSTVFNPVDSAASISSKACSTDSQTESNSPHNEIESGDTNFASSEQSQSSSSVCNNVDNESENGIKKEQKSSTNQLLEHSSESDKKLVVNGEHSENEKEKLVTDAETPTPIADGGIIGTTNGNDQVSSKSQDISSNNSKDEQQKVIKHGDVTTTTTQPSNSGLLEHNFIPTAAAIFHPHHPAAAPAHFFVAPPAGFISFAPPPPLPAPHHHTPHHPSHGQNIYINDTNMQSTRVLNNIETVDTNRQRYIQKRRRRKLSRSQNEVENKYSDHSDSTGEEFEDENRKKSHSQLQMSNQNVKYQENSNVMIEKSKKLQTNSSNIETDRCVSNDEQIAVSNSNEKSETKDNTNETREVNSEDKSRQIELPLPVSPVKTNSVDTIVTEEKKSNAEENTTNTESICQNGHEETLEKTNDTSKENKTTVYKVDAEEFIPRSMRQQTPVTDTEKIINPELRAKFENYLNRQDLPDFPIHNFVPNSEFVYAIPTSSAHTAEIYINPLDGISDHVTNSISFPSHNKFIPHQQFASRKQHSFGNNYNNKKKQKYSKPNYYYRKSNSVEASTSTQDEEFNGEIDSPQSKVPNRTNERLQTKMDNQPMEEKNNSNTQEVTNENTIKKTEQNGVIDKSTELVSPTKENVGETKDNTKTILPEEKIETKDNDKNETSMLVSKNSNTVSEKSKENITPPIIPLANDKPKNITRNREISKRSPTKINKSSVKTAEKPIPLVNNITTVPKNTKNYAQILQKVDNDKKNLKITKLDIAKASINSGTKINVIAPKSAEPVHKPCPKLINGSKSLPTTPDESEWISVPSRKKSKNKYHNQNVSTSLHENYLIQETIEEVIKVEIKPEVKKPVVEEIVKVKEVKESTHLKKDSLEENNSQKVSSNPVVPMHSNKASPSTKNKNKNTTKQKREPSVKKTSKINETKIEKHLEKPKTNSNDNESNSNNSAKLKDEVNNQEKVRKTRSKSLKKTPQKENPVYNYSNTAIIESIDNLRKMANEHSKTNLEISQEMDRIIQQGLYKNLGEKIRTLDQDEKFLSVLDTTKLDILPRLLFESKFQSNDSVPEFNIMETLTECQKLFAYKSVKDANDIKDIKHTNIIAKSRENSVSKEMAEESKIIENIDECVQVKKIDNFTISDKSCNLSASSVNEDESVKTDTVEITATTNEIDLNFSNNETKSDIKSTEIIDEIDFKNVPSTSGLQNNDADLSDNDETLISFKFDSNENISVITEEPHASIPNDFIQPLSEYNDDGDVSKHSPDPDSWSSHTNMTTTTEAHSVTTSSEFTAKLSSSHKSLTEVVKEWLHEAKEKTPDLDVLKSPDKLYREKSAPPKLYRQYSSTSLSASSGDESEPEVGTNQSKNVKGNPLFAASVNSNHSFLSLMGETLLEPIAKSGYTSSVPGAAIGEDALLVNRRVASNSDIDHVHIEEEYNTTTVEDFKTIAKRRIKENVAVLAREFVNTVNPVVDGVNISENERLDEFKINTNYCCEVNEHTDLSNENNLRDECRIARTSRKVINITNNNANDNNNGTNFMIRGAFVRDVGVIKRAVSENGAIFNNIVNNVPNINYNEDVNKNVNKSKSCVDMKLLFVKENAKRNDSKHTLSSTTTSTTSSSSSTVYTTSRHLMASREGSQESTKHNNIEMGSMDDLLECWDHDLLNNEKPMINVHNKNDARICIKNNLTNSNNDMTEVSKKKELNTDIANRKEIGEHDNDDEIIENYESMYGKNFDFLEIRQKVLNECEQQRVTNGIISNEPPCVAGRGAVCCSVM